MADLEMTSELREALHSVDVLAPASRWLAVALAPMTAVEVDAVQAHGSAYCLPMQGDWVAAGAAATASHAPWLPFDDQAFDTVLLYRLTSHNVDMGLLLGEAARVLRRGGSLLMLEWPDDFSFAPLPDSGASHLLHQWLREAGFASVHVVPQGPTHLVATAHL